MSTNEKGTPQSLSLIHIFNIVFQDYALFPNLNVRQNITYGLRNKPGISSQEEVQDMINLLGLGDHLNKRIDQLSGCLLYTSRCV